ncbi:hypothetical protein Bca4012_065238 [Brassica carinata]|uniref:Small EDRK-rich factor-like N-terminal domain-containing protein n=1 Tax=Brassica carinata TaxID=52824 RepID=A0A8X7VNN1_BRACI|nr:hypothetical protein Bca52824_017661 [Brassica carinata]
MDELDYHRERRRNEENRGVWDFRVCHRWRFLSQRERDRERAAARAGGKGKSADDGLTPEQRRERDGKALQEKAAKKAAQAAAAAGGSGGGGKGTAKK